MGDSREYSPAMKRIFTKLAEEGGGTWATYMMMEIDAATADRPVQEPVAWVSENTIALLGSMSKGASNVQISNTPFKRWTVPLYAAPQPAHGTSATERDTPADHSEGSTDASA